MTDYRPIACSLHDELEALATLRHRVVIRYRRADGTSAEVTGRIADITVRGGAEYVQLAGGEEIRLDHLERAGDVMFGVRDAC